MTTVGSLERRRRLAGVSVRQLARDTGIERRRLNFILRGLTPAEIATLETVLKREVPR